MGERGCENDDRQKFHKAKHRRKDELRIMNYEDETD
jgi:hypothetical protein